MDRIVLPKAGLLAALLMSVALWGCGQGDDKGKKPEPTAPPQATPAPKKEAPKAAGPGPGWTLLGQKEADHQSDKDRIRVGGKEGKFKQLVLTAKGGPLTITSMTVTVGNGKEFKLKVAQELKEGQTTKPIDLPGDVRHIKHVDLVYRTAGSGKAKATVMLYGR
jgi:hypothetical protein